tara:strand:+ start:414 stop:953 length:540 start_codon:yes stop_codon:yes gene_type:complete
MTTFDFTPLFRSTVGFDRLQRIMDASIQANGSSNGYPPYNIAVVGEDDYRITMAVAGFAEADLDIQVHDQTLTVTGKMTETDGDVHYLHHGIAGRDFIRKFELADHVKVAAAHLENGLLTIDLQREIPEEKKPRTWAAWTSNIGINREARSFGRGLPQPCDSIACFARTAHEGGNVERV